MRRSGVRSPFAPPKIEVVRRSVFILLVACGSSAPAPAGPIVRVQPVANVPVIVDAGPKCVAPSDEALPKWIGTYPKILPHLTNEEWAERAKMLLARNPGIEAFFVDQNGGAINGFTSKKTPFEPAEAYRLFVAGRGQIELADLEPLLGELRCANPDVARFEPTNAALSRSSNLAFVVMFERRPSTTEQMIRSEPLPQALDNDTLAGKWHVSAEVARVHRVVVHLAPPHFTCVAGRPCDPPGPRTDEIEKRVVVGKVPIDKKYLKVNVTRGSFIRATGIELRLVARVEVRWDELRSEVLTPRFGATLEPALAGNFQEMFDAVTGASFDPTAQ